MTPDTHGTVTRPPARESLKVSVAHHAPSELSDFPELLVATLLAGEESATELTARLAWAYGHPLTEIYEILRTAPGLPIAGAGDCDPFRDPRIDESLGRIATRLSPSIPRGRVPQALVLSTHRHGVPAAINHLMNDAGLPASTVELACLVRTCRAGASLAVEFPALTRVIIDGGRCSVTEAESMYRALREVGLLGGKLSVTLLVEEALAAAAAGRWQAPELSVVSTLPALMTAVRLHPHNPLTERERGVLACAASGSTDQQAARALGISIATVKTYLERAQAKLQSVDRASAVATAIRRGWL